MIGIGATLASASQIQRSVVIEPFSKEKLEKLESNISKISAPAQELFTSMEELEAAQVAYEQNGNPASKARYNVAKAVAIDKVSRFIDTARTTKTPLVIGFQDLADYLEVNAVAMNQNAGKDRDAKRTVAYMQRQAQAIRGFANDFEGMVEQFEECGSDLSKRAAGWAASSRVLGMMENIYGSGGTEAVYSTMADVVNSMSKLKSIFNTEDLLDDSFNSEKKEADLKRAKTSYKQAVDGYYNK